MPINLCDSCIDHPAECTGRPTFGTGKGNDNVVDCKEFAAGIPDQPRESTITLSKDLYEKLRKDFARLNYLDNLLGSYTGSVILRMSKCVRGMRLHETSLSGAKKNVRVAIDTFREEN